MFWLIHAELPKSPGGLARDAWRGIASPNCSLPGRCRGSCERLDTPALAALRCRRAPTATSRLRPGPRGSRCLVVASRGARCAGSPQSASALLRTAGQSPRQCRRKPSLGWWGASRKRALSTSSSLPGEPEMALLDHQTSPFTGGKYNAAPASTLGSELPSCICSVPWLVDLQDSMACRARRTGKPLFAPYRQPEQFPEMNGFVEISTFIHLNSGCTCRLFITVCTESGSGM